MTSNSTPIKMQQIKYYYPQLSNKQIEQFAALKDLYTHWNAKINVVSRKDIDNLYIHHVLHSLGIEKMIHFKPSTTVLDVGTGGGFPGIPLAILFPEASFVLLDSIGKKINVAQSVVNAIELTNVQTIHSRIQELKASFHFVVSRAVMPLGDLIKLTRKNIADQQINALPNGLICLKGGELDSELAPYKKQLISLNLQNYYKEPFFDTKKVIYIPL